MLVFLDDGAVIANTGENFRHSDQVVGEHADEVVFASLADLSHYAVWKKMRPTVEMLLNIAWARIAVQSEPEIS